MLAKDDADDAFAFRAENRESVVRRLGQSFFDRTHFFDRLESDDVARAHIEGCDGVVQERFRRLGVQKWNLRAHELFLVKTRPK